jgi:ligand-binding SRPBCC domain-containing protein
MPRTYQLSTRLFVARDLDTTFRFFADAGNLQRLTPPWLDFQILTPLPITMREGVRIDYRITVHGVPLRWQTAITEWVPPHRFVDRQVRGPYRLWEHAHTFRAVEGGTLVEDTVRYRPLGGALVHAVFVRRDLKRIFTYRQQALLEALGAPARVPCPVRIERVPV